MSAGSFWRSASRVTTTSPRAGGEAGQERRRLAGVAPEADEPQRGVARGEPGQHLPGGVGAPVVHHHDLVRAGERVEGRRELREQRGQVVRLVVGGDDDRDGGDDVFPEVHAGRGQRLSIRISVPPRSNETSSISWLIR
jgi:hypothetical protein